MLALCLMLLGEGERALFQEFHARYERKLYAVAMKILRDPARAEDAVSAALLKVAEHFETFLKIYEKDREKIGPWAVIIVKNAALDLLRREGRLSPLAEDWDAPAPEDTEGEAAYRRLVDLIRSMPEGYRQVLELKFVAEWSTREIARATGLSEKAVEHRIARGRALLIKKLREEGYADGRGQV